MKSLFFLLVSVFFFNAVKATNYYFSNNSGNDDRTAAQAQNPSTPWKTLNKLNSFSGNLAPGDHILFKRGETFFGSININRSGSADQPIVFSAYGDGDKPVITSLVTFTNWTPTTGHKGVYESTNDLDKTVSILLINNVLQQLGRYPNADAPNKGYLTIKSHNSNISITDDELPDNPNWTGAQAVIRVTRWKLDRVPIISHAGNTITYKAFSKKSTPADNYGYFIQNDIKTLDEFGEWYFDPSTNKIYVYFGDKSPSSYLVQASSIPYIVHIINTNNIVFDNLSIRGAETYGFRINSSDNVTIQNCDVLFSGNTGIFSEKICSNLTIQNCNVAYSNSWGIKLSNCVNSIIKNNIIRNSGAIAGMGESDSAPYKGLEFGGSDDVVENNEIDSSGYMGINFSNGDNLIIKNNVVNTFGFVKDDGGGIYSWEGNKSTAIYSNRKVIGNIVLNGIGAQAGTPSPNSAANGIYMDDGVNGVEITGNTVANTFRGVFLHNAFNIQVKENTVFGNTVACYLQHDGGQYPIRNNMIVNNTFFSKLPNQLPLEILTSSNDIDSIGTLDNNYYCRPSANDKIFKQTYKNSAGNKISQSLSLTDWKNVHGKDPSSRAFPIQLKGNANPDNFIRFEYNPSANNKTITLRGNYIDVNNNQYSNSIVLKPYSSIILMKQTGRKFG